jgi:FtsH-binding integral membrane protein
MDYKKLLKPLSRITLFVLIVCVIYEIVKLFRGEGDITDVIGLICIIVFLFVILPILGMKNPKP